MAYVTTNLPNNGRTRFFNFNYDDALSRARGLDVASYMMNYCDDDLNLLAGWFSGRQLDMSPPIHVSINTVAVDARGNPTQDVGGSWGGATFVPLQVGIGIGELPMEVGTAPTLARFLLVAEVSEMYMRAFNAHGPNPWFRAFTEGSKGEALSRFLSAKFLTRAYPSIRAIPSLVSGGFAVSNVWLNNYRDSQGQRMSRENFLEVNNESTDPNDPVIGCGALFLFFLHDQLGHSIEDIINAGAGHLSNVYENLTGDSWTNAWGVFSSLVNSHYPNSPDSSGFFRPLYDPPLDTLFPVSDLTSLSAPGQVSWANSALRPFVSVRVDHPAILPLSIAVTSSHPAIIPAMSLTIGVSETAATTPMVVNPQAAGFAPTTVTLTASYAGRTLTSAVNVVSPAAMPLPSLQIVVDGSSDPCQPHFVAGGAQTFTIANLSVFPVQAGLTFAWTVSSTDPSVTPDATDTPTLTISVLPASGTAVTIHVSVTNQDGLHAEGDLSFTTIVLDLRTIERELRCRINRFKNLVVSLPTWNPEEQRGSVRERLNTLEQQVNSVSSAAASVEKLIRSMKKSPAGD